MTARLFILLLATMAVTAAMAQTKNSDGAAKPAAQAQTRFKAHPSTARQGLAPAGVLAISFEPKQVKGGEDVRLRLNLNHAGVGPLKVKLACASGDLMMPKEITVPGGVRTMEVKLKTKKVKKNTDIAVSATHAFAGKMKGLERQAKLTLTK